MTKDEASPRPTPPTSYAPSSEPFYSNIPAAPISSLNYSQAPPIGSDSYGPRGATNPYSDMGYAALPGAQDTPEQEPEPWAAAPEDYSREPSFIPDQAPSIEDLHRAPGNPYADRSGRALTSGPAPRSAYSVGAASPSRPRGVTPPGGPAPAGGAPTSRYPTPRPAPAPSRRPKRRAGCLVAVIAVIAFGSILFQAVTKFAANFIPETSQSSTTSPLDSVADTDLQEGMCFDELEYVRSNHLQPIPCDEPHRFEVAENVAAPWGAYPGEDEVADFASGQCRTIATDLTSRFNTRPLTPHSLYPSEGTWQNGDRTITCFVSVAGSQRLHGSAHEGDLEVR